MVETRMELNTPDGYTLVKIEDLKKLQEMAECKIDYLHKLKEIAHFIGHCRNTTFRAAGDIKKLDSMLQGLEGQNGNTKTDNTKTSVG